VPYQLGGARFPLPAVEGKDRADVHIMVAGLRKIGKLPATELGPRGTPIVKDPLNGELLIMWRDRWLWGAIDDPSPHRQALVEELGRKLPAP
jgi:hypothetical protein